MVSAGIKHAVLLVCVLLLSACGEPDGTLVTVVNGTTVPIKVTYDRVDEVYDSVEQAWVNEVDYGITTTIKPGKEETLSVHLFLCNWYIDVDSSLGVAEYEGSLFENKTVEVSEFDFAPVSVN